MKTKNGEAQVPEFVAWGDISQTYSHEGCSGEMEWDDDFTVKGIQYVIHRCNVCDQKEQRSYPLSMIVM